MAKSKKVKSAERFSNFEEAFMCPLCEKSMKVIDFKSMICTKNHTFDFAKQGYVNLLTGPSNSHYKKELFEARHKIIMESNLYTSMHAIIANVIMENMQVSSDALTVLDVGCGEGSHLHKIVTECNTPIRGIGLDISKEGIALASKRYENYIWIVGDLAESPFKDQSIHTILNIFSPSNYKEFKRLLVRDGLVIKVVPGPGYLKELREMFFDDRSKKVYQNKETVSLFKKHFRLLDTFTLRYTKNIHKDELKDLVAMTPLSWSSNQARSDAYVNQDAAEITVDVNILVGIRR